MCSVQADEANFPTNERILGVKRSCMKCDQTAVVIIRSNDPFCKECFLQYCTHKFRLSFGKSKLVRDQEQVLVAYSGGSSSCAMLHLVQEGLSKRAQKKLRFVPTLLYLDESSVLGLKDEERDAAVAVLTEKMQKSGLSFHILPLEKALWLQTPEDAARTSSAAATAADSTTAAAVEQLQKLEIEENYSEKLQKMLSDTETLTAKESLLHVLRIKAMVNTARQLGFSKVLIGDSSTRLSIRMLSNITQGRGAHLSLEMNFADCRHGDVTLVRPMRELSNKEIAVYNKLNSLESTFIPTLGTKVPSNASIEKLTEEFVTGLQANFPTTVSTICRTGEKLELADVDSQSDESRCCLCQAPIDTGTGENSALGAILFSQNLCKPPPQSTNQDSPGADSPANQNCSSSNDNCCGRGDGSCNTASVRISREEFLSALCYGCRLVVRDMKDFRTLPPNTLEVAARTISRNKMKESINDYLLEEGH